MNSGQYLKDCKAQIRETDVEGVRKTVESKQEPMNVPAGRSEKDKIPEA